MDAITLRGMRFHTLVGLLPHEGKFPQPLELDVTAYLSLQRGGEADETDQSVDDEIRLAVAGDAGERLGAEARTPRPPGGIRVHLRAARGVGHHEAGAGMIGALGLEDAEVAMRRQPDYFELTGVATHDVEHVATDRAGRSENDHSLHGRKNSGM